MKFEMKPLPYAYDALQPHISEQTVKFHYDKHHTGYMTKLQGQLAGTPDEQKSLQEIVETSSGGVFNLAAQIWNHDFYWQSLTPNGGGAPGGELAEMIAAEFGDFATMRGKLKDEALGHFGSGWAWLVLGKDNKLQICSTHDADNPLRAGATPLLTVDVWEHAYYLDTQNDRGGYLDRVLDNLLNWQFAEDNLSAARKAG
ncbi:superoxide dismutase [Woeseia oceani]|uniref:Superoxide dismutase n=1 Tax=Woeseia oceani TaxID=1548547 RepID=A0A193LCR6_9GAMM|nr:superoxide dismutase [Woeseia oceani]ANO50258.1 superoxide dismutase [Woeseia oceani]